MKCGIHEDRTTHKVGLLKAKVPTAQLCYLCSDKTMIILNHLIAKKRICLSN